MSVNKHKKMKTISIDDTLKHKYFNSKQTFINQESISCGNSLKNASIILEKINHKDVFMNKHCEELKYAIINKTKQIFDKQDELFVKTRTVLNTKDNQLEAAQNKNVTCTFGKTDTSMMLDNINKIKFKNKESNLKQIIKEQEKQSELNRRCLFITKKQPNDVNTNDNISKEECLSQLKSKRDSNNVTVTEINKNFHILNVSLNTSCKSVSTKTRNHGTSNFFTSKDQSLSVSNISAHEDILAEIPIACSTMIHDSDKISDIENGVHSQSKVNPVSISNMHQKQNVISMDITEGCEGFILCDKLQSSARHTTNNPSKDCLQRNVTEEQTSPHVEVTLLQANSNNKESYETSNFIKATTTDNDIQQGTNMQWKKISIERDSANTIQTSLNVNTSIDLLNENNKNMDKCKQKHDGKTYTSFKNQYEENTYLASSPVIQESINTVCTSLQMNTSLHSLCMDQENYGDNKISEFEKTKNRITKVRESNATGVNMYEANDVSSTKKFENMMTTRNVSYCSNDQNCKNKQNKKISTEKNTINNTVINNQCGQIINKIHSDKQSYMEAIPYPVHGSDFLKSQNIVWPIEDSNQFNDNKRKLEHYNKMHSIVKAHLQEQGRSVESTNLYKDQEEVKTNTIVLNDSHYEKSSIKLQTSAVIKVADENKLQSVNNRIIDKKRCKKKLLPLHECSQISFSPIEKQYSPPQCTIFKKNLKRKNKYNKINVNNVQNNEKERKKDYDKKKNQGKKPKKIVSKQIIIKKIVNQDILRRLNENRENFNDTQVDVHTLNRNSSNDFQFLEKPSAAHLSKKKIHKINIVATGLSNEDKNIIKSVVKALGCATLGSSVTKHTTHVVTTGVRTINLLYGIIRGCWLVTLEWVLKSLENNAWLNPEEYEMAHFSKAVQENRKDRQLFGLLYVPELFTACGYIHVEKNTTPPCNVLKDLIKTAGGCIVDNPEIAKIVIGKDGLKETWVLDCITSGELQPCNQYQRY